MGPYDILRLARNRGLSTTEFITRHTEAGGTILRREADGACVFLTEQGCGVHPDRPLVCRIYPLARWNAPDGSVKFGHLEPHPQTAGVYGRDGTVDEFLSEQGLAPYFAMSARYGELYGRMTALLERIAPDEAGRRDERRSAIDDMDAGSVASRTIDVDDTVRTYCTARALPIPDDIEALVAMHIRVVNEWLDEVGGAAKGEG